MILMEDAGRVCGEIAKTLIVFRKVNERYPTKQQKFAVFSR